MFSFPSWATGSQLYRSVARKEAWLDVLGNVPVPIFRIRISSNVGSHTKSSHIWQYTDPVLDSTSNSVSLRIQSATKTHTESMFRFIPMRKAILFRCRGRTLQAQVIRCECNQSFIIRRLRLRQQRGLRNNWTVIEDHPKAGLVVRYGLLQPVLRPWA